MKQTKEQKFIYACQNNYFELIKKFIKEGEVDVNCRDGYGNTSLIWACSLNNTELVKELLKHPKINLEFIDICGYDAYDYAKEEDYKEIMLLLKMHKLKQTIKNNNV